MQKLILISLIFFCGLASHAAVPARIQSTVVWDTDNGTTLAGTLNGVTAGNFLAVVFLAEESVSSITSVAGNSNTYTATTNSPSNNSGSTTRVWIYYASNVNSGNTTVTVTFGGTPNPCHMWLAEFSGVALVSPFDIDAARNGQAGTSTTANDPCMTTRYDGELLIAGAQHSASITSENAPWEDNSHISNGNDWEWQVQSTRANVCVGWTTDSGSWTSMIAGFRPIGPEAIINNPISF